MFAAFYTKNGPAHDVLQFGEVATPEPGPGEVRVRIRTSGVNPSDWKARSGSRPMIAPLIVPHSDGAGEIEKLGAGVDRRIGERVWIWNGQWKRAFGTAAEFIVVPSAQAPRLPEAAGFDAGACLGIPVFTALQAVRLARVERGSTVLVVGGAGSVAHYAIQLAKMRGARVITTVSNDVKAAHARAAGADEIVNYRTEDVGARIKGVDAVIEMDLNNDAKLYPSILAPHATIAVYGMSSGESMIPSSWMMQNSIDLRLFLIYEISEDDRASGIAEINCLLEENRLIHTIARRMPLEEIAEAHDIVERGEVIGNVVLEGKS
ncbi:MAG: NADPH:quinone reductase [Vulcanimicrobiaceae bacterium]|jgi:NADPH2:quinone reductase